MKRKKPLLIRTPSKKEIIKIMVNLAKIFKAKTVQNVSAKNIKRNITNPI